MANDYSRTQRVNQQIQKELASILMREIKDPRLGMITINDVEVSRDLSFARVYITFFDDEAERVTEQLAALEKGKGYIRRLLGSRMKLRIVPELKFVYDKSLIEGIRMTNLVTDAVKSDNARRNQDGNDTPEEGEG